MILQQEYIANRITFKIKKEFYLKVLTPETMRFFLGVLKVR